MLNLLFEEITPSKSRSSLGQVPSNDSCFSVSEITEKVYR